MTLFSSPWSLATSDRNEADWRNRMARASRLAWAPALAIRGPTWAAMGCEPELIAPIRRAAPAYSALIRVSTLGNARRSSGN